ncbi:uncharacterized protein SOCEGT47_084480 [Sorangium cellulosum]|uniref:Secreted protein n=1 Tax=Sorangium cellulosum TaxID=56 RepID=A0A4P2QDJ2_SORCE|nr:hypothetical protein [Sorangium cellulosum]AUX27850.1 uncharacterized protein SOCEGT47_084480 [Sorangium cellulosum]
MRWIDALRRWAVVGVVFCVTALSAGAATASEGTCAPDSTFRGWTLAEWMREYIERYVAGDVGGSSRGVTLMPLPVGEPEGEGSGTSSDPVRLVGSLDVTLRGTSWFAVPISAWVGETYNNELPDDAPFSRSVFTMSNVLVTLDGRPIIDSATDDLSRYYFGPEYFEPPLFYDEPTSSGAIGVIFFQGLGFVHGPLRRGEHTLHLQSEFIAYVPDYYGEGMDLDIGIQYDNTWNITVAAHGGTWLE